MLHPEDFFDLHAFEHKGLFDDIDFVWEALNKLPSYIQGALTPNVGSLSGAMLPKTCVIWDGKVMDEGFSIEPGDATRDELRVFREDRRLVGASVVYAGAILFDSRVSIGKGVVVEPGALIKGPTIIGNHSEVRQGAYLRGNCLVGSRCVVGHATEVKTSIMLDDAKAGHFAYIGDSILGNNVNLGAGTKLANLKIVDVEMKIRVEGESYQTGLRKLGAILGDKTETGCNSVTSPGTLLGKASLVYPCVNVPGGFFPRRSIISGRGKKRVAKTRPDPTP
ncbi:MAG: glucose-1-phosphate thymidylyltransferase [Deltaproteobacteria bacterium]|nr:glucose-1-phosphate thymidylyltransferase [Deltaproteobacteria bacterium]